MKRLIRDKTTDQYLQHDGSWGYATSAHDFDTLRDVALLLLETDSPSLQLVLTLQDDPSDDDLYVDLPTPDQLCTEDKAA